MAGHKQLILPRAVSPIILRCPDIFPGRRDSLAKGERGGMAISGTPSRHLQLEAEYLGTSVL
jgi:hypothetical protein